MADGLYNLSGFWTRLTLVQRVMLVGVVLAVGGIGVYLANWMRQPTMVLLKGNMTAEEAAAVEDKVKESGVAYEVQGTRIMVDGRHKDELILLLAKEGLVGGDRGGYELLDKEKIGASPSSTSMLHKRALEGEVEKLLKQIQGVVSAKVIISQGETSVFGNKGKESSASVVVTLDNGLTASPAMIRTMVNVVSGAVNMRPERVVLADNHGQPLAGNNSEGDDGTGMLAGSTYHDYKTRVDEDDAKKIQAMLDTALGSGRSSVKVSNVISTKLVVTRTETPVEGTKSPLTEKTTTKGRNEGLKPDAAGNKDTEKEETTETTYPQPLKSTKEEREVPGVVQSKSVAVFVDLNAPAKEGETPKQLMQVKDVEDIVKAAVGITDKDTIKVVSVAFNRPVEAAPAVADATGGQTFTMDLVKQGSIGVLGLAAVGALWVLGRGKAKANKLLLASAGSTVALAGGSAGQLAGGSMGLLPGGETNPDVLRAQITKALQDNPEEVKRLFLSWVDSDKEAM